jgi:hypothetical protein
MKIRLSSGKPHPAVVADPPLLDSVLVAGGAANTYSLYDMFGRQLFLAFSAKF